MKLYAENESGVVKCEHERKPMPEKHFRALCGIAYAAIITAGEVAGLYLVGPVALMGLLAVIVIVLMVQLAGED